MLVPSYRSPRVLATRWTYFLHTVILIDSSTESPVHVLMLSIQAVRGLPRLRAPGIVPCIISFSRQLPRYCSMFAGVHKLVRNGKYMRTRKDRVRGRRIGSHYECRFASIGRPVKLSATARSPVVMAAMPGPIQLVGLNTEYLPSLSRPVGGVAQW